MKATPAGNQASPQDSTGASRWAPPEAPHPGLASQASAVGRERFAGLERGRASAPHPVFWVIATALVVIAAALLVRGGGGGMASPAWAQPVTGGGMRGVFAFSGQLASGAYGVYMVDVDSMTLWCYEYQKERGCMRLAAARSWKYDRYLEQFNACDITPADVERLIEDQRAYKQSSSEEK